MEDFLKEYDASKYEHPSVTVDILIFSKNAQNQLSVLLTKRKEEPFKGMLALPGGFIGIKESLEECVDRVLKTKLNLEGLKTEQLYTFGNLNRDPRTRVISVAYFCLLPNQDVIKESETLLWVPLNWLKLADLAFDHKDIIEVGKERIKGKLDYTLIAFDMVKDKNRFTIYELQKIFECIQEKKLDTPNFRRMFNSRFYASHIVDKTGEKCKDFRRESDYYKIVEE